ncbi:hypothetical protein K491DRAFT_145749 [Lophiostoma macrostomum CBS 122681]|uniref:Uncharacterized protein n=1 Tax=Lophiostoma macrostomum CBS 122681 TaxID=1314788 RepID=A0A6A6SUE4_9PLEO|nr:hypothetical protein K491DRAFT_145749 [Lophiostoma macrostomum CBS 122681]
MFYDLNVPWTENHRELQRTIAFLDELGYDVVALTHSLSGKLPADLVSPLALFIESICGSHQSCHSFCIELSLCVFDYQLVYSTTNNMSICSPKPDIHQDLTSTRPLQSHIPSPSQHPHACASSDAAPFP